MQFGKLSVDLVGGEIQAQYDMGNGLFAKAQIPIAAFVMPALEKAKADLESGALDPVKGTDFDKQIIEGAIDMGEQALGKV